MYYCNNIQKSLDWCMGTPELPGIMSKIFYISKNKVVKWPKKVRSSNGQVSSAVLEGSFVLAADAVWHFITILPDKSQLTSDAQGEAPSQTQLNKLVAVHPGVGADATAASAYLNNSDSVFIVQDMKGNYRVLGCDLWTTKCTVAQDNGQGPTGTTSTTITIEAPDEIASPFYVGQIITEDGIINEDKPTGKHMVVFTSDGPSEEYVTVNNGNYQILPTPITYDGEDYYEVLKIETDTQIKFTTKFPCTMTIIYGPNDTKYNILVDGIKMQGVEGHSRIRLSLTDHTLTKCDAGTIALLIFDYDDV